MNRTKFLSILALAAALCLLTACGAKDVHPAPADNETTESAESGITDSAEPAPVGDGQFVFTRSNFPRLDGSTATVPLGQAVASVLLGESREKVADIVHFSKTTPSYRALMNGDADILLAAEPAPVIWAEKDDGGYDWDMAPFAVDGLVFVVNASNPTMAAISSI